MSAGAPPDGSSSSHGRKRFWDDWMIGRTIGALVALALMALAICWVEKSFPTGTPLDRIFRWSFVVFSVGLGELFLLLVVLSILGRIDIASAFEEKDSAPPGDQGGRAGAAAAPKAANRTFLLSAQRRAPVSLSRLQAFLWTLVIITSYFYKVASRESDNLPTIPPELLLVMGISGAVYLAGKQLNIEKDAPPKDDKGGGE